jgi:ABC-type lipoprotein release transport system permease subunit
VPGRQLAVGLGRTPLVGVRLLLLTVVSVAALIRARRTARVDPVEALRTE